MGKKIIIHGDGTSLWTMTHSEDFAKGIFGLLGNQSAIGESFHITSDEVLTWNQIYEYLADAVGIKQDIIHVPTDFICKIEPSKIGSLLGDKAYSTVFNNSKIKRFVPDFKCVIPFRDGIKQTINWFEQFPEKKVINNYSNEVIDRIINSYMNS
jgi:nucleoside-diphosphate-sugar epimerase